ncbi:MAG: IPT/TIG domain-containing protein [Blastocatellia bacterium]|nr:IPT/TIG domain-containing protein [Blastocatellia bacterium]
MSFFRLPRPLFVLVLTVGLFIWTALVLTEPQLAQNAAKSMRSKPAPAARPAKGKPQIETEPLGAVVGTPWKGLPPIRETTDQIMKREQAQLKRSPKQVESEEHEPRYPDRSKLPQSGDAPATASWPPRPKAEVVRSFAPQAVGTTFAGPTLTDTGAFPPDTMGAVGPTQFLVGVNGRIRVYDKATGAPGALNSSTNTFFSSVRNGSGTSDPRVRFDRLTNRWFIIIINVSTPNRVLLAVSDGPTITGSTVWSFFFFLHSDVLPAGEETCLADYPTLGIDAKALYIGVNQFCGAQQTFSGTTAFVVNKSTLLAGSLVVTAFRGLTGGGSGAGPATPQGVDNFDPNANVGYLIGTDNASLGRLVVRRISDPGGIPSISPNIFLTVPATSNPITVRHFGNTGSGGQAGRLDGLDDRLFAAHLRNGRIWTAHNIGVNLAGVADTLTATRNGSRWYEIDVTNPTPTLVQAGTLFDSNPESDINTAVNFWIPTVMVSGQGHMAMVACQAGGNATINAVIAGRLATDDLGTIGAPTQFTVNTSNSYNPTGDSGFFRPRRWGDYSYVSVDPMDDMTMWGIQEFCHANNSYRVDVVKIMAPPPPSITGCTPASVTAGQASVTVTISGSASLGEAFFEPGPSFAKHLTVQFTGGITVNSVTVVNATTLSVNLSTVGAQIGSQGVLITNPDGQSRSVSGILAVIQPNPTVTQFYPVASTTGKTITITGTNFVNGNTQVFFGGANLVPATSVTVVNGTTLQAVVPASGTGATNINGFLTIRVPGLTDATTAGFAANAPDPGNPTAIFPEFVLWGDTNGDGMFATSDVSLTRAFLLAQATPTARQFLAANVVPANANGSRGDGLPLASNDFAFLRAVSFGQATF